MNATYEDGFKACTWDVDGADRLTIAAAYNYCQEVAGDHASVLGVGSEYMQANGLVWILSRMSAELDSRPPRGSRLRVKTWPRGTDRLFAVRDYELSTDSGAVFGRGRSAWLVVDAASFRPRRPEILASGLPTNEGLEALADGARALPAEEGLTLAAERRVTYSDIDCNGHVNNARYVQWIADAMDPGLLQAADRIRLDLNYLAELKPGATAGLYLRRFELEGPWRTRFAVEGRIISSAQTSFRASISLG